MTGALNTSADSCSHGRRISSVLSAAYDILRFPDFIVASCRLNPDSGAGLILAGLSVQTVLMMLPGAACRG